MDQETSYLTIFYDRIMEEARILVGKMSLSQEEALQETTEKIRNLERRIEILADLVAERDRLIKDLKELPAKRGFLSKLFFNGR